MGHHTPISREMTVKQERTERKRKYSSCFLRISNANSSFEISFALFYLATIMLLYNKERNVTHSTANCNFARIVNVEREKEGITALITVKVSQ